MDGHLLMWIHKSAKIAFLFFNAELRVLFVEQRKGLRGLVVSIPGFFNFLILIFFLALTSFFGHIVVNGVVKW